MSRLRGDTGQTASIVGALAAPHVPSAWPRANGSDAAGARLSFGPVVLAAALPLIFLHSRYQPDLGFGAGGTHVSVTLSDLAVLAVALAAIATALQSGLAPLRRGLPIWLATAALLVVLLVSLSYPALRNQPYDWHTHLVSALKFCEYATLAPAVALLVPRLKDATLALRVLVVWGAAATSWGVLQYLGLVHQFLGHRPAERQPSFLGYHDFAALSGAVLALALVAIALRDDGVLDRRWTSLAVAAGGLGIVVSGAMTAVIGMWLALAAVGLVAHRRRLLARRAAAVLVAAALVVTLGTAAMRGSALKDFAAFLGLTRNPTPGAVESYSQRTVLGYIGLRIFLTEPITGVGYQASSEKFAYGPRLPAARRRFPDQPAEAFPSPAHPWGVQNLYIQALADVGVIGFAVLGLLFGSALWVGMRGAATSSLALIGVAWFLVSAGVWNGLGIVPGIPLAALTWLGFGLASTDE
jgi:O-antigen ligase